MESKIECLTPQKHEEWDKELRMYGIKVQPENAVFYEMEEFLPSYLFVEFIEGTEGLRFERLAFYTRNDRPFAETAEGKLQWYQLEAGNVEYLRLKIREIMPSVETREGVSGYIIPLQESAFFSEMWDVNAYLRNLMFWESMLSVDVVGPVTQRISYLAHKTYQTRREQRDAITKLSKIGIDNLPKDEDSTIAIVEAALSAYDKRLNDLQKIQKAESKTEKQIKLQHRYDEFMKLLEVSEKEVQEGAFRYEQMRKQVEDLQRRLECEDVRNVERKAEYRTFGQKMRDILNDLFEEVDDDK